MSLRRTMKFNPVSITAIDSKNYRVAFDQGDRILEYDFDVDDDGIPVLGWEQRFWEDMGGDFSETKPLFQSIMAFHEARLNKEEINADRNV